MKTAGILIFLVGIVSCVDKSTFKTCSQSGFCSRLRVFKPDKSQYVLDSESVLLDDYSLSADVNTVDVESDTKEVLWLYTLKLSAIQDGTFRIEINEKSPLYPRYVPEVALNGNPKTDRLTIVSNDDERLVLKNTQGHKVVINAAPLKFEFYDVNGEKAIVLNENSQLLMEPLKKQMRNTGERFRHYYDTRPRGDEAVSLDIQFPDADYVYGIPEHTDNFYLKTTTSGEPYRLYNVDVNEYELDSRMALYGSVPVLYAHGPKRSAGVFWHNSAETWVDVEYGRDSSFVASIVDFVSSSRKHISTRFMSESGIVDLFVFLGNTPSDVFRQYSALTGTTPLPPKFSLAYHQCRWNYMTEKELVGVSDAFDEHDIPADVLWLDVDYTDDRKYFTWRPGKFDHPHEMVANITAKGRKLVIIVDPHIKRQPGYFLHEDHTEKGLYVKDVNMKDYEGHCWPGASSFPDFYNPATNEYFMDRYLFENFPGTSKDVHIWNDLNEPTVFNGPEITMPKDNRHYKAPQDGQTGLAAYWEHRHIHNEYSVRNLEVVWQSLLKRTNGKYRPFILTRAFFAGAQRYAAVWTGDNKAEWGFLQVSVPMCLSLATAGISFCGSDVGGFFKYPDAELMTRWYQAAAYQPFFRAHSHLETPRREPWLYDRDTKLRIREAIRQRYSLLDYWYTLFYEHTQSGLPVLRPLFQEFPKEEPTYTIDDTYLLGDKLLVRPVLHKGATSVRVYLPGAESRTVWYDTRTYQAYPAAGYITVDVNINTVPVFQRGGSIVPRKERLRRSSAAMDHDPYTLVVALDLNETAQGTLYIDDGGTYDYRTDSYIYAHTNYEPNVLTYKFLNEKTEFKTRSWVERVVVAGIKSVPRSATLHQGGRVTSLQMILHQGNDVLVIRKPAAAMDDTWKIHFEY